MSEEIKTRIIGLIAEKSGAPIDIIKPESNLVADLGMDSLDLLETCIAIESEFDIYVSDEEFERCATVGDIIDLVTRKVGA